MEETFQLLRRSDPELELLLVGRNPTWEVKRLANIGVMVTGGVPDVQAYLKAARGVVAPLQIARSSCRTRCWRRSRWASRERASEEVCCTFQPELPRGL